MISAKVVAHTKSMVNEKELISLEVVMPRFILAEFNTHRMFSRNSASSRAIPFRKMVQAVKNLLFTPIAFQKDHSGMQGNEYLTGWRNNLAVFFWWFASRMAIFIATILHKMGVTKQLANRLLEPFMYHKVLVTATEWENFFDLRCPKYKLETDGIANFYRTKVDYYRAWREHQDKRKLNGTWKIHNALDWLMVNDGMAEIHMMELAECIYRAVQDSKAVELMAGQWHLPYGDDVNEDEAKAIAKELKLEFMQVLVMISVARCARTSYTTIEDGLKHNYKADIALFKRLATSKHLSPFEHVAKVMEDDEIFAFPKGRMYYTAYEPNDAQYDPDEDDGISKVRYYPIEGDNTGDKYGWCFNFCGFIPYRYYLEYPEHSKY